MVKGFKLGKTPGLTYLRRASALFRSAVLIVSLLLASCSRVQKPIIALEPGQAAPNFRLKAVRGGTYGIPLNGHSTLLSFLNTQAQAGGEESDPSRAQITFLKSMQQQYSGNGLTVLIIDASSQITGKQPSLDDLINFTYDWQLDGIQVLADQDGLVRNQYGIVNLPTTFLIGPNGVIQQRWDTVAASSQLALAIEAMIGPPNYRMAANAAPTSQGISCVGEPTGQAKFSGVGLARSLSNEIWVVDKGQAWNSGGNYPLQWIVLDDSSKAGKGKLHLHVAGQYFSSGNFVLIDQPLAQLPDDDARGLLGVTDIHLPKVYFLTTTVALIETGCLHVQATVTNQDTGITMYEGEMLVTVH